MGDVGEVQKRSGGLLIAYGPDLQLLTRGPGKCREALESQEEELLAAREEIRALRRKCAEYEKALAESEGKFRAIFEQSKHGVAIGTLEGTVIFYNRAYEIICGYTMSEVNERGWFHLVMPDPERRKEAVKIAAKALNGKIPYAEFQVTRKDGRTVWISFVVAPITIGDGKYVFSIATDTTESHKQAEELQGMNRQLKKQKKELEKMTQELLKHRVYLEDLVEERTAELKVANKHLGQEIMERLRAERNLREANELLEKVFSNINVLVAYMDTGFNFFRVNRAYADAEGYEPEFFTGKNHFDMFPNNENRELFRKVVESGEPFFAYGKPFKYFRRYRRETEYWDFSLNPVKEEDGKVSGLVLSLVNVTNRNRAVKALRESERKFRKLSQEFNALLDAIPDILILLSPDMKVLWANRGAASAFGRELHSIAGHHCYELWQHRAESCERCAAVKCFETEREESTQLSTTDGRIWNSRAFPLKDDSGSVSNVIVVSADITERMMLQAEVMRADHLASVGKLAAGVAHEINNPINGIINYAQILANKSPLGSKEHDIARRIIREGDRIAGIVRSLLSFARDRKGEKAPVQAYEALADSLALTEAQMRKDGINVKVCVPPDLPEVVAKQQQIQQVFLNIIDNARYALNRKFEGKHKDKVFVISGEKALVGGAVQVRIIFYDRGIGMPPDILDKVINPFFSTKPSGTGLGLSISHGIIADHGGRLFIESTEGEFARITVSLPARKHKEDNEQDTCGR